LSPRRSNEWPIREFGLKWSGCRADADSESPTLSEKAGYVERTPAGATLTVDELAIRLLEHVIVYNAKGRRTDVRSCVLPCFRFHRAQVTAAKLA
jgi:hypothetical protein